MFREMLKCAISRRATGEIAEGRETWGPSNDLASYPSTGSGQASDRQYSGKARGVPTGWDPYPEGEWSVRDRDTNLE